MRVNTGDIVWGPESLYALNAALSYWVNISFPLCSFKSKSNRFEFTITCSKIFLHFHKLTISWGKVDMWTGKCSENRWFVWYRWKQGALTSVGVGVGESVCFPPGDNIWSESWNILSSWQDVSINQRMAERYFREKRRHESRHSMKWDDSFWKPQIAHPSFNAAWMVKAKGEMLQIEA